jgi:TonB family protein
MFASVILAFSLLGAAGAQSSVSSQWPSCPTEAGHVIPSVLGINVDSEGKVTSTDPLAGDAGFLERAGNVAIGATFAAPMNGATLGLFCSNQAAPRLGYIFHPEAFKSNRPPVHIALAVSQANLMNKVPPAYPPVAKARNIQGVVVLSAVIDAQGDVASLQPVSGRPELMHSAIEAVRQWKYKPFLLGGKPVPVSTEIEVRYSVSRLSH